MRVTLNREVAAQYELYAQVNNVSVEQAVEEALDFWMQTAGAAVIFIETGCEIDPTMQHNGPAPATIN